MRSTDRPQHRKAHAETYARNKTGSEKATKFPPDTRSQRNNASVQQRRTAFQLTYQLVGAVVCIPSRSYTLPCRAAGREAASPHRCAAGSAARVCMYRYTPRMPAPPPARKSSSSRSRAPSPADSPSGPEDTWRAPSDRTARTAHKSPR